MNLLRFSLVLAGACLLTGFSLGDELPAKKATDNSPLDTAFEKLKSLAGEWSVTDDGKAIPNSKFIYRVFANGSAVMETLFPGTPMEMISIYHRDGKKLVMTHYCAAKNQPRFEAELEEKTGAIIWKFVGGTNLDPQKDMHVHGGKVTFVDDDNVISEWEGYQDGKSQGAHKFKLTRVKKKALRKK